MGPAQLYRRALGSLAVAFHDSRKYGIDILARLHTGEGEGAAAIMTSVRTSQEAYVFTAKTKRFMLLGGRGRGIIAVCCENHKERMNGL